MGMIIDSAFAQRVTTEDLTGELQAVGSGGPLSGLFAMLVIGALLAAFIFSSEFRAFVLMYFFGMVALCLVVIGIGAVFGKGVGALIVLGLVVLAWWLFDRPSTDNSPKHTERPQARTQASPQQDTPIQRDVRQVEKNEAPRRTDHEIKGGTAANLERVLMAHAATRNKPKVRKAIKVYIRDALQASQRLASNKDKGFAEAEFRRMLSVAQKSRQSSVSRWEDSYDHPQWVSAILTETLFANELSRLEGKISIEEYQAVVGNIARFAE